MITIDVSKLPHLDARQKALAAQVEVDKIEEEKDDDAALQALIAKKGAERSRLYAEMNAAMDEIDKQIAALEAPYDARIAAVATDDLDFRQDWDADCRRRLCVLSGLPILEDEEVVEDTDNTGGLIIRALLPFPVEVEDAEAEKVPA
jgi:hypothetical protein